MGIVVIQAPAREEREGRLVRTVDVHTASGVARVEIVDEIHEHAAPFVVPGNVDRVALEAAGVAPAPGDAPPVEPTGAALEVPAGDGVVAVLEGTVAEVRDAIATIADRTALDVLEAAEAAGKGRAGVLGAIARRREVLATGPEPETRG